MGGKAIPWESQIEKDFIALAEMDPTVREIYAQPLRVGYEINGVRHTYVPDFALVTAERTEIHEVKPDDAADELQAVFAAIAPVFAKDGLVFCISRESAIRVQQRLKNVWALWRELHVRVPATEELRALSAIGDRPGIRICDLGVPGHLVHALVAQGSLRVALDKPLSASSSVWLPSDFPYEERLVPFHPVR